MRKVEELQGRIQKVEADVNSGALDKLATETSQRRYRELVDGKIEGITGSLVFERLRAALPLTAEDRAELDRRWDAYKADGNPGRCAEDVIADIRRKL